MTEIPHIGAGSLTASIDEQIAKLMEMKLPSLRAIHSARRQVVKLDYDRDRETQLKLKAANGRPAHPGHQSIAETWIDMLKSTIGPAELLKLKAKVMPSKKGVGTESAAYFAATILATSTWPANIPYPEATELYAVMTLKLSKEDGEPVGDVWVDIGAVGGSAQTLDAINAFIPSLAQDRGYYWQRCCEKMTPWFQDGGISDLTIMVPMRPASEPFADAAPQGTRTIH